jgi:hypothetical protein
MYPSRARIGHRQDFRQTAKGEGNRVSQVLKKKRKRFGD